MNKKDILKYIANLDNVAGVNSLLSEMKKLDDTGRNILLKGLSSELSENKKQQILGMIRSAASETDKNVRNILVKGISNAYVSGMNFTQKQLRDLKFKPKNGLALTPLKAEILNVSSKMTPHLKAVNALISDVYLDFGSTMTSYVKGAERILNDTLKRQIRSTIAEGRLQGSSIAEIKKVVKENLGDKGFTVLIDRGGNSWSLDRYSELLARTHTLKANNEGVVNRALDFEVDIVEISEAAPEDDLCISMDGKLFSLSGNSENYDELTEQPPFHPNCRGTLLMRPDLK